MRTAAEYVDAADRCHAYEMGCMSIEDAIAAVQAALNDSEKYRMLLMKAIRTIPNSSTNADVNH